MHQDFPTISVDSNGGHVGGTTGGFHFSPLDDSNDELLGAVSMDSSNDELMTSMHSHHHHHHDDVVNSVVGGSHLGGGDSTLAWLDNSIYGDDDLYHQLNGGDHIMGVPDVMTSSSSAGVTAANAAATPGAASISSLFDSPLHSHLDDHNDVDGDVGRIMIADMMSPPSHHDDTGAGGLMGGSDMQWAAAEPLDLMNIFHQSILRDSSMSPLNINNNHRNGGA